MKKKRENGDIPIKKMEVKQPKKKLGRPVKYNDTIPEKARALAAAGGRDVDIAKALGISRATLDNWKVRFPDLLGTLKEGKEQIDKTVENALLRNALGYTITETKRAYRPLFKANGEPILDDEGKQVKALLREEVTTKEVQPSTVAQIFWLKNRNPDVWRDAYRLQDIEKMKGEVTDLFNQWKEGDAEPRTA